MIRVLDFDFLFQNENSNSMITVLSKANSKVLTRKSIKAFVKLMWQEYQPAIIRKVFTPYLLYLQMMILLCARSMPNFWIEMEQKKVAIKLGNYDVSDEPMKIICRINIYFSLTVLIYL